MFPLQHRKQPIHRCGCSDAYGLFSSNTEQWLKEFDEAFDIVSEWRNIHGVPLRIVSKILEQRALSIDESAINAQRLKRYRSIRAKLIRSPVNNLTTMQDIAGCRAVLSDVDRAYQLKDVYESRSSRGIAAPDLVDRWTRDYIENPKPDGYRSIHLVLKFQTSNARISHCNGLRVEVQIRSQMQHAWAMAVETASAVTNQALKSGIGEADWKRFFWLVGDIIASTEGGPLICGIEMGALRVEAAHLARTLKVIPLLENMQHVFESFSSFEGGKADMYLLELDSQKREITYEGFSRDAFANAAEAYSKRERETKDNEDLHVVLVSVASLNELKRAYPSYFLDSSGFITVMRQQIFGR
jgi:ppGpp synthetase/RelA/SpoT-type nucleotidyltranferase